MKHTNHFSSALGIAALSRQLQKISLQEAGLPRAESNLPSEAFLLSGTFALHGDGCLSLATLDELLCLLGKTRRKKEKKNMRHLPEFLIINLECVCSWISWQVC